MGRRGPAISHYDSEPASGSAESTEIPKRYMYNSSYGASSSLGQRWMLGTAHLTSSFTLGFSAFTCFGRFYICYFIGDVNTVAYTIQDNGLMGSDFSSVIDLSKCSVRGLDTG